MEGTDPDLKMQSLGLLIAFLGLLGALVVMFLLISWRRQVLRLTKLEERRGGGEIGEDVWQISADRMVEQDLEGGEEGYDEDIDDLDDDDEPLY